LTALFKNLKFSFLRQIFFGQPLFEEQDVSVTQFVPLSVTQLRVDKNSSANGDARSDDDDGGDKRPTKRRRIQINFETSILEKLSRPDKSEENSIPWIQIIERMVEKFPNVFLQK
jgi:hypothetical protein